MRHRVALALLIFTTWGAGATVAVVRHPPSPPARVETEARTQPVPVTTTAPPPTTTTVPPPVTTATTASPAPAPPPPAQGEVEQAILQAFGPEHYGAALRVARCESSLDPTAASRTGNHVGLFQLSGQYHRPRAQRLGFTWEEVSTQAWPNAAVAADLWREQGWRPWTCKP